MDFNPAPPRVMHVDLNSCFASIEQQANPLFREKPLVVAAYDSPGGCILAASLEAKKLGIKTGMRVREGKLLFPNLVVLTPDPDKYRFVHLALRKIIGSYTNNFTPKSIDEFTLNLEGYEGLVGSPRQVAEAIKKRVKKEVGDWLTVSIGIGPNRFLAKTASNLRKPDGLEEINKDNFEAVYRNLDLRDLSGINHQNEQRLKSVGISRVADFYNAPLWKLKAAFHSIAGYYWFVRLRGWEVDGVEFGRKSFGNSFALPHSDGTKEELLPILARLCEKAGGRMRRAGYSCRGIWVGLFFRDLSFWNKRITLERLIFDSREIYRKAADLLDERPNGKPVHTLAVSCFGLVRHDFVQTEIFSDVCEQKRLVHALDRLSERWGDFAVSLGRSALANNLIKDRIAFGQVRELLDLQF